MTDMNYDTGHDQVIRKQDAEIDRLKAAVEKAREKQFKGLLSHGMDLGNYIAIRWEVFYEVFGEKPPTESQVLSVPTTTDSKVEPATGSVSEGKRGEPPHHTQTGGTLFTPHTEK